jgi:branched-chain amino acid transport system permease protein
MDFSGLFSADFLNYTLDGVVVGAIYALVSLGYTMVYGVLRLINFAHSEIFMLGTFAALGVTFLFGYADIQAPLSILVFIGVFLLIIAASAAASGGVAVLLELVAYRNLRRRGANRLSSLISAIGASLFLTELFRILTHSRDWAFPEILSPDVVFSIGTAEFTAAKIIVIIGAAIMMLVLERVINRTKLGLGIRAVSQDEKTAVLMGVNVDRVITFTFLLGGILAGVAASFYMLFYGQTKFNAGFLMGISAFTAAVLGGIGNIRGALVGSFALGLLQQYASAVLPYNWRDVVAFVVLVLVLLVKPTGLLGEALQKARV